MNHFCENTQLWVGLAKIKPFHSQNTQFWADFENELTPLGTKQKIHECLLKEALPPFFSVTVKSKKTYSYQWKPKNKGLLLFQIIPLGSNSKNKCLGLQMARMEMDCILKKWGYVSHVYSFCLGNLAKILIMVYFLS